MSLLALVTLTCERETAEIVETAGHGCVVNWLFQSSFAGWVHWLRIRRYTDILHCHLMTDCFLFCYYLLSGTLHIAHLHRHNHYISHTSLTHRYLYCLKYVYLYSNSFYYIFIQIVILLFPVSSYCFHFLRFTLELLLIFLCTAVISVNFSQGGSIKEHLILRWIVPFTTIGERNRIYQQICKTSSSKAIWMKVT